MMRFQSHLLFRQIHETNAKWTMTYLKYIYIYTDKNVCCYLARFTTAQRKKRRISAVTEGHYPRLSSALRWTHTLYLRAEPKVRVKCVARPLCVNTSWIPISAWKKIICLKFSVTLQSFHVNVNNQNQATAAALQLLIPYSLTVLSF